MFEVSATTTSNLLANLNSQLADSGTLTLIAVAAGIPLAFYVIRRVIALIPSGRGK